MIKYSLDLTNKQELRFLSDLIADVRARVPNIDILLVGATARDLLLFYAHGIKAARGTEGIDLAFAVARQNYLDAGNSERLYSEAAQLLENPDFDYERAGAWLAGRDALETIQQTALKRIALRKYFAPHSRVKRIRTARYAL